MSILTVGAWAGWQPASKVSMTIMRPPQHGHGVASVGRRPTVNPVAIPLLEVHLFDHDADLYGEHLRVRFLKKLRDEQKYDGLPALQAAIARDARQAREFFLEHG